LVAFLGDSLSNPNGICLLLFILSTSIYVLNIFIPSIQLATSRLCGLTLIVQCSTRRP
jgi:hypothetical protein